jgi:hypothetical protein
VNEKSFLIVLDDLSTIEEWDCIKACFPNNKKGSRIIVSTELVEVASLCVGPENITLGHKQLSVDLTLYAFYDKVTFEDLIESHHVDFCTQQPTVDFFNH